ncbi:protein of unknown function DUF1538 [Desulfonatronospira thiodismutans ASO3-1]|uniref:DUF1538 domain-containing protein n=1 Tax=Desulfonatronospira thiodismutans ASO3-1 TaxID=555779 RepID=D6SPC8_9BACT|nr:MULTISPECIES: DUF1538 domain-containing protein [Desulfonatronospira]EFI34604.1 protein of unknown function DUF1538 [Desulfonatronospira thiodismutans ASO3-1]RQD76398.1 MAG: DUF1538 domain-containing protein [Desulfonatronospira sp. MSAO_Bac3]
MTSLILEFLDVSHVLVNVLMAVGPLLAFFIFFQFAYLQLDRQYVINLFKGVVLAIAGLTLFLQGVEVGFMPVGAEMGEIMNNFENLWILIPIGFVLGLVATIAEPAVRILCYNVERASAGSLGQMFMLITLSLGVGVFVAMGMGKIIFGFSIYYILLPGYILALLMMKLSEQSFISIAFDAGGVATGPMTVTFVMAIALGLAEAMEGRSAIHDGFGLIALVALAPILSVMTVGVFLNLKTRRK